MFERFTRKKSPESDTVPILPSDVRYALQYRDAKMQSREILALANNKFEKESFYLLAKAFASKPEQQAEFLEKYLHILKEDPNTEETTASLKKLVNEGCAELGDEESVAGNKLAQLSRQGFEVWNQLYSTGAEKLADDENTEVFIIGHSTFIGFDAFVKSFSKVGRNFHILIPEQFENETIISCGYTITEDQVLLLDKSFTRAHSTVVDDMVNTGKVMEKVKKFWVENGKNQLPEEFLIAEQKTVNKSRDSKES